MGQGEGGGKRQVRDQGAKSGMTMSIDEGRLNIAAAEVKDYLN
jgi:hypothetical protein